ncbi:MAG: DUF3368 domain-containing protein [Mariprofundaceae bacterium]|nr:DUF3368 domain-containing protein [Mariprofundaceae bacterium]
MRCVSNASPIIFLSKLNALELLTACFDEVHISHAVVGEVTNIHIPNFLLVDAISDKGMGYVEGALGRLHSGELESMVLAKEISADYVLLDDLLARRKATSMGLQVMGTVGVIHLAYKMGKIDAKQGLSFIQALTQDHNLYLSQTMLKKVTSLFSPS